MNTQATALNTGSPTGFPRINAYVIVPNESGAVVAVVVKVVLAGDGGRLRFRREGQRAYAVKTVTDVTG